MAKKKQKKQKKQQATPVFSRNKYIKEKGRSLPIVACWVQEDWEKKGLTYVLVVRQHKTGNYTVGAFLVDTYCLGVKDSLLRFHIDEQEYKILLENIGNIFPLKEISYVEAHNLIYGAIAFAEEAGISPHKSFAVSQYLLEEDTEDIPLLDMPFGQDGKYYLCANSMLELNTYLPILEQNLSPDEFKYDLIDEDEDEDEEVEKKEDFDPEVWNNMLDRLEKMNKLPDEKYSYQHGAYPTTLQVKHQQLVHLFYDPKYAYGFPDEIVQEILNLPHEELRHDIEQICLYETGCTCDTITDEMWNQDYHSALIHSLFFLGELKNPDSLPVVLEMLKQNDAYLEYHFGDLGTECFPLTIYFLGREHLEELYDYMQTPGLDMYARTYVVTAVKLIAIHEPERRPEVIDWFHRLLQFYLPNLASCYCCSGVLISMITAELLDIRAIELLPDLKALYDTDLVDTLSCGNYTRIEQCMTESSRPRPRLNENLYDIFGRYHRLNRFKQNMKSSS